MNLDLLKTVYIMPPIYSKVKWIFIKLNIFIMMRLKNVS